MIWGIRSSGCADETGFRPELMLMVDQFFLVFPYPFLELLDEQVDRGIHFLGFLMGLYQQTVGLQHCFSNVMHFFYDRQRDRNLNVLRQILLELAELVDRILFERIRNIHVSSNDRNLHMLLLQKVCDHTGSLL